MCCFCLPYSSMVLGSPHDFESHSPVGNRPCQSHDLSMLLPLSHSFPPFKHMKKIALTATFAVVSLMLSSCCSMFGIPSGMAGSVTETRQVKTCRTDTVTEQVLISSSAKGGNVYETVEKKVPRYRTVTRKTRVPCGSCVRFYCPRNGCCGTTGERTRKMATAQPSTGSPHIGLMPTMRPLVE